MERIAWHGGVWAWSHGMVHGYRRRVRFLCWFFLLLYFVAPGRLGSSDFKLGNRRFTLGRFLFGGTGRRGYIVWDSMVSRLVD